MRDHTYRDFDEFVGNVRDADGTVMIRRVDEPVWRLAQVDLPGVRVQIGRPGSGNIMEAQASTRGFIFHVPLSQGSHYRGNGIVYGRGSVQIIEPGAEFCHSTSEAHEWCGLFVPTALLLGGGVARSPIRSEGPTCRVISGARPMVSRLEALVRHVAEAARVCDTFENSTGARLAAATLLSVARPLLGIPRAKPFERGRPRVSRADIIRASFELLEERPGEQVLVSDLAARARVSERTLRTAFNEHLGVGVTRYLELKRLHAVHRALRAANADETNVTDLLAQHGVWAFGRFAGRYRRLFNERPSETLAGNSRNRV